MAEKNTKRYEMDMCNGPIFKKIILFTLPLMASSLLQLLFNAADIIVVGRFAGDNSLAAVGSTSSLVNLLVNLFMGLSIGANVLVARFYGARREKDLRETIHTSIAISIVSGLLLTVIGFFGAGPILKLMGTPEEVLNLAVIYLRVYFAGMPAMMLYNFGAAILRAVGDTKRPLRYLSLAGVVNVILNLIFVIVFRWDVFGVGFATTISQVVSAVCVIRCLWKEEGPLQLHLKEVKIHKNRLVQILKIGLPAGFQGILFSLSNVVIQSSINLFGATVVAGNSAASNVEGFVYAGMNSFYQAAISFTSQNYGAKKYDRIKRILFVSVACSVTVGGVMGMGAYLLGPQLLSLYTSSQAVIDAGMVRLSIIAFTYALCGFMDTIVGTLRGIGYSIVPMIVSLVGVCALRLLWISTIFQIPEYHTIRTVYIIYPISWVVTAIAHFTTFAVAMKRIKKQGK